MDILDKKTDQELAQSALAEIAKAKNEVQSAERDIQKAKSRLNFLIVLANKMIDRKGD
jgi:xanthine/CO dehydrogenase XdhC/CoxF family maturation factor